MTLFTWAIHKKQRRLVVTAAVYGLITLLCILFHRIYILFSYGEDSAFLRWMFLCPLAGGLLPSLLAGLTGKSGAVLRPAFNLWNSGVAVLTFGCLVRGIIEISGRFTSYDACYWWAAGGFFLAALLVQLAGIRRRKGPGKSAFSDEPPSAIPPQTP